MESRGKYVNHCFIIVLFPWSSSTYNPHINNSGQDSQWKASNTDQSEITQILQSAPNGQSVGLKAKLLFKGDKETVYSKHAKKKPHQM